MKTLTVRTLVGDEPSSHDILLAALQSPGPQGVTYDQIARRMPIIDKLKAAKETGAVELALNLLRASRLPAA